MDKNISDKEWLDLAWKHFQQHAQQKIFYFNYFVIFSTLLTTGFVATFQYNYQAPYLGVIIGVIQSLLSFVFWQIEVRNRFLTKHAENILKRIESDYQTQYAIFSEEEKETKATKKMQLSHHKSYVVIYGAFFLIGLLSAFLSYDLYSSNSSKIRTDIESVRLQVDSSFSILQKEIKGLKDEVKTIEDNTIKK